MDKKKLIGLIIGIILFAALIVGATFAWLTYAINVTNGNYNVETSCFDVNYENGADISGTLNMVANPLNGRSTTISMGINEGCNVNAKGKIELVINSISSKLYETTTAHCENALTLETLLNYPNQTTCETNSGETVTNLTRVWTTDAALKYAIYEENFSGEPIKVGHINQSTGTIILLDDFQLNVGSSTKYYISIWLDGNIADSQYVNQSFSGYIKASAIQQDQ